ncbi:STAS domain-containing protein [Plantactinospora sp. KLBMP9567]|uniref:STAS domain-containing protein n=1 Tax=Plantactinospora sp. KLBMP9567 TaxID=3085900 RepID=UPI002980F954|nr:STAS domain-containing protein [Plantactinospora sp. KLBMP9567]MDW5329692.1 STAS domain-containing protein [Plantactinospora sp. KLBMP9567]
MTLIIATRRLPDASIAIQPDGAITSANAFKLRDRVTAVLAATKPDTILVDLRAVPAIDDAGVDALRSGYTAAAACGAALVVVESRPSVYEHLRTRGLTAVLPRAAAEEAQHQVNGDT